MERSLKIDLISWLAVQKSLLVDQFNSLRVSGFGGNFTSVAWFLPYPVVLCQSWLSVKAKINVATYLSMQKRTPEAKASWGTVLDLGMTLRWAQAELTSRGRGPSTLFWNQDLAGLLWESFNHRDHCDLDFKIANSAQNRHTVRLGSTNYFFPYFHFLCLLWHVIKRYGWEISTVQRWASNSQYWWSYGTLNF